MDGPAFQVPTTDHSKGPTLIAIYWVQFAIAFVFVISRIYARFIIRGFGWDDAFIVIAMALDTACTAVQTRLLVVKGIQSIYLLTPVQIEADSLLFFIYRPLQTMAVCFARVSVASLLLRIIGFSVWRRWVLYICIAPTFVFGLAFSIIGFLQCTPLRKTWDPTVPGTCLDSNIVQGLAVSTSSWNAVVDLCLVVLPVTTFARLQMDKRKKIGLCALMSTGVLAAIAAAVKAWQYSFIGAANIDFTEGLYSLYAVAGVELLLIIVCACIPTLKPIYDRHFRRRSERRRDRNLFPTMPTGRQASRQQPQYQLLVANQNDDPAAFPSSFPMGQPLRTAKGEKRVVHEEYIEAGKRNGGRYA